ncbi:pitrilysin family protein [Aquimarina sp. MMG016]|uniref:M16 family metallopeptidase n=1 Tax=Aquimarina sp. MMG016 TaxID=2822690 RepID=UPI001B3A68E4|nr:pitrilysin family protein [Aquimarina sp. MMG016]MBQ4819389.1 insulinase family protein [Aquimarina sp. MMG016]
MKKNIFIITLLFLTTTLVTSQEKETPPEGSNPKGFTLPKKDVVKLDNGLTLVMIPYGSIPKSTIRVSIETGNIHEKENEIWLSDLMADLLEEGSTTLNAKQIADKMAGMGGNLNIGVSPHHTSLNCSVLYEFTPDALALISDVVKNPAWPASELDRLKNNMKRNLTVQLSRPQAQASKEFFANLYPNHPYGNIYPTEEILNSFTIEDVKKFYAENIGAKRTTVYVAGKFDKDRVIETVKTSFSDMVSGPEPNYPTAQENTEVIAKIIDRPEAPQSTIYYGLPVADPSSEDHIALSITNSLLGGSFGSRITSNIREDKGYTYSPRSTLNNNYKSSLWFEVADVTTEHTGASLDEINKEIRRLQNEAPSKEELDGIKNYESGIFVLRNSTPGGIINQLEFLDMHELDDSYLVNRVKNIHAVTPEQVQEMTKKYINPEKMTLVIVGDKNKVQQQVQEIVKTKSLKQ